jgi:YfiH family protein
MTYAPDSENPARTALCGRLGISPERLRSCVQTHSKDILVLDGEGFGSTASSEKADGLVSTRSDTWLSVTVADCLPIYLIDTDALGSSSRTPLGLVHSGWKGTGIVTRALELMAQRWNTRAEGVAAILGPCIRGPCYTVDESRARSFEAEFGGPGGPYPLGPVVWREGVGEKKWHIDLQAANGRLLAQAGVRNIAVCEDCTYSDDRLGSFRREGSQSYTRMAAMVGKFTKDAG